MAASLLLEIAPLFLVVLGALVLAVMLSPAVASARSGSEFAYPYARVWTVAIRLLRIDMDCPITEKDKEEGYFFFDYTSGSRSLTGSVQIVRTKVNGVDGAKVIVQIPAMPRYVEKLVLKKLGRKLKSELGAPLSIEPVDSTTKQLLTTKKEQEATEGEKKTKRQPPAEEKKEQPEHK